MASSIKPDMPENCQLPAVSTLLAQHSPFKTPMQARRPQFAPLVVPDRNTTDIDAFYKRLLISPFVSMAPWHEDLSMLSRIPQDMTWVSPSASEPLSGSAELPPILDPGLPKSPSFLNFVRSPARRLFFPPPAPANPQSVPKLDNSTEIKEESDSDEDGHATPPYYSYHSTISGLAGPDLSGSDLSCSTLSGSDLSGSDLQGSGLPGSGLPGSDLRDSQLQGHSEHSTPDTQIRHYHKHIAQSQSREKESCRRGPSVSSLSLEAERKLSDIAMDNWKYQLMQVVKPIELPNGRFQCPDCEKCYKYRKHVRRHYLSHTTFRPFNCPYCSLSFHRLDSRERHINRCTVRKSNEKLGSKH